MRSSGRLFLSLVPLVAMVGCAMPLRVGSDFDREVSFDALRTYDWIEVAAEDAEPDEVDRVNPFLLRRLERAVDHELEARGFRKQEDGPVDLLLSVAVLEAGEAGERGRRAEVALMFGLGFGYAPGLWGPGLWAPYGGWWGPWGGAWSPYRYRRLGYGYGRSIGFGFRPYFGYPYGYRAYGPYGYYGGGRTGDLETLAPGSFIVDVMDGESGDLIWRGWANGALAFAPGVDELPEFIASVVHDIMERFPPESGR